MACCLFCAGEGFCSKFLSIIVSLTFSFHLIGILSPHWLCDKGVKCNLRGIYYSCNNGECESDVPNKAVLTLAVMVLISSLVLSMCLCCILNCSNYRYKTMTSMLALVIGGWYIIQEIFTTAMLIAIAAQYDRIGWSTYVFTVPGMIMMCLVIVALIYLWCNPKKTVYPI